MRLPSFKMKDEIVNLVENNQVVVLSGETGEKISRLWCNNQVVVLSGETGEKISRLWCNNQVVCRGSSILFFVLQDAAT